MPSNLQAAVPTTVFPQCFYTGFAESRIFPMRVTLYHDNTIERALITDGVNPASSIRSWKIALRCTSSKLTTLRTFYETQVGPLKPFYWYNPFENAPGTLVGSNYDAAGYNTQGRHVVRFSNDTWFENVGLARTDTSFDLIEVA